MSEPHPQRGTAPRIRLPHLAGDVEDRAKVVSTEEIEREDWTLNISRYVLPPVGEDVPPLPEALAAFKTALTEARSAEDRLRRVLVEDGWLE